MCPEAKWNPDRLSLSPTLLLHAALLLGTLLSALFFDALLSRLLFLFVATLFFVSHDRECTDGHRACRCHRVTEPSDWLRLHETTAHRSEGRLPARPRHPAADRP